MISRSGWKEVILRDLCRSYRYGYTASAQEEPIGPKFLRITDIVPELIDWSSVPHCEIPPNDAGKYRLRKGDIVVARTGATTGYAKRIRRQPPDAVFASYLVRLRIAEEYDDRFVGYVVESDMYKRFIMANIGGAAQPNASAQVLTSFPILLPPLPTQRKIGGILSYYDDLIENNACRIAILEKMAQMLYREWFVHFRFPGHEHTEMVDSDLGSIPKDWKVVSAGDRFEVELGGTPARKEPECWENGDIPWIKSGKVNELRITSASEFITSLGLNSSSTEMMPRRTTVLAITGATLGQVSLLEIAACANQSVVGVYDQEGTYSEYLYLKFCEIIDSVVTNASGSAQQHINKGIVSRTEFLIPDAPTMRAFNELIRPVFDLTANLIWRNTALVHGRDLLLPRLVSGELDVGDLPIDVTLLEA